MKVRELFEDPNYSDFTETCVRIGEAIESLFSFRLDEGMPEYYSQGEQTFHFTDGKYRVTVHISEEEE